MQKTFYSRPDRLALALLAASLFAPAVAQGQDGVTLYGRLDVNLTRARGQKWHMDRASHSGSEDLGGGLRAQFQLESRISLKDGAVDAVRPWGRQAWLGLRGPWGALRMGRSYSPSRYATSSYDAMDGGIGTPGTRALLLGHASATFVRFENGVYYETPRLAGLALSAAVSLHAAGGAKPRRRARSLRLHYRRGAADLSVAKAGMWHQRAWHGISVSSNQWPSSMQAPARGAAALPGRSVWRCPAARANGAPLFRGWMTVALRRRPTASCWP